MVFMAQETMGKARKLALPHHGPYHILEITPTGASVQPVDCPDEHPILVNLDRVTRCPDELPDVTWLGPRSWRKSLHLRQDLGSNADSKPLRLLPRMW